MLHSIRCFANMESHDEVKLMLVIWAMESMAFHGVQNVIFAIEFSKVVGAVTKAWPCFGYSSEKLLKILERFHIWKLILELRETNRGAFFIHSYVAVSFPEWLHNFVCL